MKMLEEKQYLSLATFEETIAAIAYLACNKNRIIIGLDDIKDKLGLEEKYVAEETRNIIRVLELDKSVFEEQYPAMLNLDLCLS
jgi:transcription initiation factor TFIIIB Brf1 subunit/transcription initiation factor TFIIB